MQVACAFCGGRFEAQRSTAKYCSEQHRSAARRARRRSRSNVVPLAAPAKGKRKVRLVEPIESAPAPSPAIPPDGDDVQDIVDAVKIRYRSQLKSPLGQLALKLARIIDRGGADDRVSGESRELRQVLAMMDATSALNDEDEDPISRARRHRNGA